MLTPVPIPRRTHGLTRSCVVPVRMSPADRDALARYAAIHASSLSAVLSAIGHQVAAGKTGDLVAVLSEPAPVFREIAHSLSRIGANLHTLSRVAQAGHIIDSTSEELLDLRSQIRALREELKPWVR